MKNRTPTRTAIAVAVVVLGTAACGSMPPPGYYPPRPSVAPPPLVPYVMQPPAPMPAPRTCISQQQFGGIQTVTRCY